MQRHIRKHIRTFVWLATASVVILTLTIGAVLAHEGRPVGDYSFIVGWLEEPAYEGSRNAVSIRVSKIVEGESEEGEHGTSADQHSDEPESTPAVSPNGAESGEDEDHHSTKDSDDDHASGEDEDSDGDQMEGEYGDNGTTDGSNGMVEKDTSRSVVPQGAVKPLASMAGQHESQTVPVEGLEETLRVEITHVASDASKTLDLYPVTGEPGHYIASLIPTAAGVYEFRVFGTVEGTNVDETFVSMGAGGGFDDIRTSAELQFPVQLPEIREIESGVRGALQTAQQAQDAALASQEGGPGNALALVALIVGIVGAILGPGGIYLGFRARQPQQAGHQLAALSSFNLQTDPLTGGRWHHRLAMALASLLALLAAFWVVGCTRRGCSPRQPAVGEPGAELGTGHGAGPRNHLVYRTHRIRPEQNRGAGRDRQAGGPRQQRCRRPQPAGDVRRLE